MIPVLIFFQPSWPTGQVDWACHWRAKAQSRRCRWTAPRHTRTPETVTESVCGCRQPVDRERRVHGAERPPVSIVRGDGGCDSRERSPTAESAACALTYACASMPTVWPAAWIGPVRGRLGRAHVARVPLRGSPGWARTSARRTGSRRRLARSGVRMAGLSKPC